MANHDWSKFVLRVNIAAEPSLIYRACTTQNGLESWFLRQAVFTQPNGLCRNPDESIQKADIYEWRWHGYPDEVVEKREVLEANGTDLLQFSFSGDCIVTVRILREAEENLVELTQGNIPTDEPSRVSYYYGCSLGWTFYLANLKSVLEGGLDLRNKNVNIPNVISA